MKTLVLISALLLTIGLTLGNPTTTKPFYCSSTGLFPGLYTETYWIGLVNKVSTYSFFDSPKIPTTAEFTTTVLIAKRQFWSSARLARSTMLKKSYAKANPSALRLYALNCLKPSGSFMSHMIMTVNFLYSARMSILGIFTSVWMVWCSTKQY
jgi:hypothetical protein